MPFCIGLASVSKCVWARGAAPAPLPVLLLPTLLALKSKGFNARSGRGSERVWIRCVLPLALPHWSRIGLEVRLGARGSALRALPRAPLPVLLLTILLALKSKGFNARSGRVSERVWIQCVLLLALLHWSRIGLEVCLGARGSALRALPRAPLPVLLRPLLLYYLH